MESQAAHLHGTAYSVSFLARALLVHDTPARGLDTRWELLGRDPIEGGPEGRKEDRGGQPGPALIQPHQQLPTEIVVNSKVVRTRLVELSAALIAGAFRCEM